METSLIVRSCKFLVRCAFVGRRRSIAWLLLVAAGFGAIFLPNFAIEGRSGSDRLIRNDGAQSRPSEIIPSNQERKFESDDVTQTDDDVRTYKTSSTVTPSRANMADDHRNSVVVEDELDAPAGLDEPVDPHERRFNEKLKVVEGCGKQSHSSKPSPVDLNNTFRWQKTDPGFGLSYVTSAFYDPRWDPPTVLIIGITDSRQDFVVFPHYCRVWYPGQTQPEVVRGERNLNFDSHGKRFHEAYHQCKLPRNRSIPYAVSLISGKCEVADNLLKVIHYPSGYQPEVNFTVCVSPVNRHYDNYHQLVENVEVNRMFGAQRVVIYNYSTGSNFARYLDSYVNDGIVEVQPWRVPVVVEETVPAGRTDTEIHYYGQVGALNDCLYRNMYRSRFIVYTDLDEMIVPRKHRNWLDMLGSLTEDPENVASYLFMNTFFRSDWNVDRLGGNNSLAISLQLKTLLVTEREQAIWPWFQRSKIIVNPRKVGWIGVHMIMSSIPGPHLESLNVRASDGLLHHYRLEWNEPQTRVLDRSMHRFSDDIISRVARRHEIVRSKQKPK